MASPDACKAKNQRDSGIDQNNAESVRLKQKIIFMSKR